MPIQIDIGPSSSSEKKTEAPVGPVVGIDLGTTHSLVAWVNKDNLVEVIKPDGESPLLPSAVYVNEKQEFEKVGYKALELRTQKPKQVLFSVKRLMGRSRSDVSTDAANIPFDLVDDELKSQVKIRVGTREISPIEVSAEILKALKLRAEKAAGEEVKRAVVTVPAYFDDAQRTATKAAGRLAGLEVIRVFNEPTAAALAYGWTRENPGIVAVYDFGGGTFDISILRIEENVFEVLSTNGNTHLGGDDLDQVLADWALGLAQAKKTFSQNREELWPKFLQEAELVKRRLSAADATKFSVDGFSQSITRKEAEELWLPFVNKTLASCEKALSDAHIKKEDLKDILMVGGSTRVPLVRNKVGEFFGKAVNTALNPDEAVALGAALQAEILSGRGEERLLLDVVPLSLGIETMGGAVSKLIHRNSTLPTEAREIYTNHAENQNAFDIHILQGERELVRDCRSLASFKLRGLSAAPAGYHRIEVLFRIDANGILNVRAKDLRTGKSQEIEVTPSYGITEDELMDMLEKSFTHAEEDIYNRQLVDMRVEADSVIKAGEKTVQNAGHLVTPAELSTIKARLIDLKNMATSTQDPSKIREAIENFDEVSRDLAELQVNAALQKALAGQSPDSASKKT